MALLKPLIPDLQTQQPEMTQLLTLRNLVPMPLSSPAALGKSPAPAPPGPAAPSGNSLSLPPVVPTLKDLIPNQQNVLPTPSQMASQPISPLRPLSGINVAPSLSPALLQGAVAPPTLPAMLKPLVTNPQQQQMQRQMDEYAKMANIHQGLTHSATPAHGFWQHLARIAEGAGNVAGDVLAPSSMAMIPGTQLNRALEARAGAQGLAGLQKQDMDEQNAASTRDQQAAEAAYQEAEAQAQTNPKEDWVQLTGVTGPNGEPVELERNSGKTRISDITGVKATPKGEGEMPLGASVANLNRTLVDRYQVLHPGVPLPPQYTLPANATQKDYDRVDKALAGVENAEATAEQRKQTETLRREALADAEARHQEAAASASGKQDIAQRQTVYKVYQPAIDSAERFNVMTKNYEDAITGHNQQAMLSLLYNHLGMTMGLQKGAHDAGSHP